ncbi:hypothetical protein [Maricaulis sp.]|uniref:hypothetical protein n=1 Tax=Maricaulis sp. TaxID=1486257 RepID=UPI0032975D8B
MMRPEFAMIGVLIGSIILAAAVQSGRPRPEPVLTDPASVDYGFSLSPDGRQAFYTHANPERTERHLYRAEMLAGQIVNASPLLLDGKTVPGGDVQIAPDGERLVFYSRDLPAGGVRTPDGDIFMAHREANGWSAPLALPAQINTSHDEYYPVLTDSGNLYFSRNLPGTGYDIFVARWIDGAWQDAERLPGTINTGLLESDAYIAPDESFMIFVRMNGSDGLGSSDLYISCRNDGIWSAAVNLDRPFNFEGVDGSPFVTADREWLYYTSNRTSTDPAVFDGHLGIYRIRLGPGRIERLCAAARTSSAIR